MTISLEGAGKGQPGPIQLKHGTQMVSIAISLWVVNQVWLFVYGSERFDMQPVEATHRVAHFYTAICLSLCALLSGMVFSFAQKDSLRLGAMILGCSTMLAGINYWLATAGVPSRVTGGNGQPVYLTRLFSWISSTMCQVFFIAACTRRTPWEGSLQCIRCLAMLLAGVAWDITAGQQSHLWLHVSCLVFGDLVRVVWYHIGEAIKETDATDPVPTKRPFLSPTAMWMMRTEFTVTWSLIPCVQAATRYDWMDGETCEFVSCALDYIAKALTVYIILGSTAGTGINSQSAVRSFVSRLLSFVNQDENSVDSSLQHVTPRMLIEKLRLDSGVAEWLQAEFSVPLPIIPGNTIRAEVSNEAREARLSAFAIKQEEGVQSSGT